MSILNGLTGRNANILQTLKCHYSDINSCDFAPNFTLVTGSSDKTIRIWDWVKGSGYVERQDSPLRAHKYQVTCVKVSPQGTMMASASVDGTALLWNLQSLTKLYTMTQVNGDAIRVCSFSPDSTLLVTAGDNGAVCIWDLLHRILIRTLFEHEGTTQGLAFTPDCQFLVTACSLEVVKLWHLQDLVDTTTNTNCNPIVRIDNIHDMGVFSIDISKQMVLEENNPLIRYYFMASGGCNNEIKLWKITSKALVKNKHQTHNDVTIQLDKILDGHNSSVTCVRDKCVRLFRILEENNNIEELCHSPLEGHTYAINYVEFSRDGTKLASSSLDGCTFIWNPETGDKLFSVPENSLSVKVCRFSPNGKFIVTGGDDEKAIIWDVETMDKISVLEGHLDSITSACISPDNKLLVTVSCNADFRIWLVENFKCIYIKEDAHDGGIQCSDFSDNLEPIPNVICEGQLYLLATCGNDSMVKLWKIGIDTTSDNQLNFDTIDVKLWRILQGHGGNVISVKMSPLVGEVVCSTATDRQARLWSVYGGQCLHVLDHNSIVTCCSFSSDCSLLATGCLDRTLWIWKLPQQLVFQTAIANKLKSHTRTVADWTNGDVIKWLDEINMTRIAENIRNTNLDGEKLVTLSENEVCSGLDLDDETTRIMINELKWLKKVELQIQKPLNVTVPDEFLCPITHEIMREPVICSDGFTYEKNAIAEWFMSGKFTSPMTNATLTNTDFSTNLEVRDSIRKFLDDEDE